MPNLSELVYYIAHEGQKPQTLWYFEICHSVIVPPSGIETKLNYDAQLHSFQLHTFPYAMMSKSFLSSNGLMAMSQSQPI